MQPLGGPIRAQTPGKDPHVIESARTDGRGALHRHSSNRDRDDRRYGRRARGFRFLGPARLHAGEAGRSGPSHERRAAGDGRRAGHSGLPATAGAPATAAGVGYPAAAGNPASSATAASPSGAVSPTVVTSGGVTAHATSSGSSSGSGAVARPRGTHRVAGHLRASQSSTARSTSARRTTSMTSFSGGSTAPTAHVASAQPAATEPTVSQAGSPSSSPATVSPTETAAASAAVTSAPAGPDGTWIVPPIPGGLDDLGNALPSLPGVATGPAPAGNVLAMGSPGDEYAFDVTTRTWILAPTSDFTYKPGTGYVSTAGAQPLPAAPARAHFHRSTRRSPPDRTAPGSSRRWRPRWTPMAPPCPPCRASRRDLHQRATCSRWARTAPSTPSTSPPARGSSRRPAASRYKPGIGYVSSP